jgi:hypothetical protein
MLCDLHDGTQREVDVVVRGTVAGRPIMVCVECRDRSRTADVTWVQEMYAKHTLLPTNLLVLASHKRFSKAARSKAKLYGIECIVFENVKPDSPQRLFPDVETLFGKAWEFSVEKVRIFVEPDGELKAEWFRATPEHDVYWGTEHVTIGEVVNALLRSRRLADHMYREARPDHTFLELEWERPEVSDKRLCVQKIEPLMLRRIEKLHVLAKCTVTVDEFPLRHGVLDRVRVAWGTVQLLGKTTLVVATAVENQPPKVSITPSDGTPSNVIEADTTSYG